MFSLIGLIVAAISVLQFLLIARIVSGWVAVLAGPPGRHTGLARIDSVLTRLTEPVLAPVRRVIPPLRLGSVALDLSIPVVLLALSLLVALLPGG